MRSLKDFVERSDAVATAIFKERGELLPMWHIIDGEGEERVFPPPPGDKDTSAATVRAILKSVNATRVLFIVEAWTVSADKEDASDIEQYMETQSLEHYNGRKEALIYMAEDKEEGSLLGSREIIRTDDGPPTLGPLQLESRGVNSGRLVGLLPTTGKAN